MKCSAYLSSDDSDNEKDNEQEIYFMTDDWKRDLWQHLSDDHLIEGPVEENF